MWLLEIHKWGNIESLETDLRIFENGRQKQWHCISVKKGCQEKNKNENKIRTKQKKRKDVIFNKWCWGQLFIHMKKI